MSIDEALSNNWLEIWYQPKIDLRRKCLAGAEALLRMHHPQAGLLWPEDCTGALDDESLVKLTEYSLVTAMRQWVVFEEAGLRVAAFHQCAGQPIAEYSDQRARHRASSAIGKVAWADFGVD